MTTRTWILAIGGTVVLLGLVLYLFFVVPNNIFAGTTGLRVGFGSWLLLVILGLIAWGISRALGSWQAFQERFGIPLATFALLYVLSKVAPLKLWVAYYPSIFWGLLIAIIVPGILLSVRVDWQQNAGRIWLYRAYVALGLIAIVATAIGYFPSTTPAQRVFVQIQQSQMDLRLRPVTTQIRELEDIAKRRLLSQAERDELAALITQDKAIREQHGFGPPKPIQLPKLPIVQAAPPIVAQPALEEFRCQAGEEVLTVLVGPRTFHRIHANQPWKAIVRAAGAEYDMPAGFSSWQGGAPEGLLRVRCLHNGTVLEFQKVR